MCWSEKCCFCVKLGQGCFLIGFATLILSSVLSISSALILAASEEIWKLSLVHFEVKHVTTEAIFVSVLVVSVLWMFTSVLLIFGVKMNKAGFVLIYFAFGTFVTCFAMLSSLLLILHTKWMLAIGLTLASMTNIHFLVVVHTYYELQVRGKIFMESLDEENDDEILISISTQ